MIRQPRLVGMTNGRVPAGWSFETRADSPTRCTHRAVVIVGNVDRFKIWRCADRCREELVPVGPGWRWDRRRRTHVNLAAEARRATLGHAYAYMSRS